MSLSLHQQQSCAIVKSWQTKIDDFNSTDCDHFESFLPASFDLLIQRITAAFELTPSLLSSAVISLWCHQGLRCRAQTRQIFLRFSSWSSTVFAIRP